MISVSTPLIYVLLKHNDHLAQVRPPFVLHCPVLTLFKYASPYETPQLAWPYHLRSGGASIAAHYLGFQSDPNSWNLLSLDSLGLFPDISSLDDFTKDVFSMALFSPPPILLPQAPAPAIPHISPPAVSRPPPPPVITPAIPTRTTSVPTFAPTLPGIASSHPVAPLQPFTAAPFMTTSNRPSVAKHWVSALGFSGGRASKFKALVLSVFEMQSLSSSTTQPPSYAHPIKAGDFRKKHSQAVADLEATTRKMMESFFRRKVGRVGISDMRPCDTMSESNYKRVVYLLLLPELSQLAWLEMPYNKNAQIFVGQELSVTGALNRFSRLVTSQSLGTVISQSLDTVDKSPEAATSSVSLTRKTRSSLVSKAFSSTAGFEFPSSQEETPSTAQQQPTASSTTEKISELVSSVLLTFLSLPYNHAKDAVVLLSKRFDMRLGQYCLNSDMSLEIPRPSFRRRVSVYGVLHSPSFDTPKTVIYKMVVNTGKSTYSSGHNLHAPSFMSSRLPLFVPLLMDCVLEDSNGIHLHLDGFTQTIIMMPDSDASQTVQSWRFTKPMDPSKAFIRASPFDVGITYLSSEHKLLFRWSPHVQENYQIFMHTLQSLVPEGSQPASPFFAPPSSSWWWKCPQDTLPTSVPLSTESSSSQVAKQQKKTKKLEKPASCTIDPFPSRQHELVILPSRSESLSHVIGDQDWEYPTVLAYCSTCKVWVKPVFCERV